MNLMAEEYGEDFFQPRFSIIVWPNIIHRCDGDIDGESPVSEYNHLKISPYQLVTVNMIVYSIEQVLSEH